MIAVLATVLLAASTPDPDLEKAEQAYQQAQYREVLPALARALSRPLPKAEQLRAFELMAFIHAAFDDAPAATEAFRRALGVNPELRLDPNASPKLISLFSEAVKLGPLAPAAVVPVAAVAPAPPEIPIYRRWYFWAGIGVAVAAGAVGTAYAVGGRVPRGTLGSGSLQ